MGRRSVSDREINSLNGGHNPEKNGRLRGDRFFYPACYTGLTTKKNRNNKEKQKLPGSGK